MAGTGFLVHGGAGGLDRVRLAPARRKALTQGIARALEAGRSLLERGESALDAVTAAVATLEDDAAFNAGRGAVLRADGSVALDTSIMDGSTGRGAALANLRRAKNPVRAARRLLDLILAGHTGQAFLVGHDADCFCEEQELERVSPEYFLTDARIKELERVLHAGAPALDHDAEATLGDGGGTRGTVGAVALDVAGRLAAATSTGGMTGARPGRVGDSPVLGAGTFADEHAAVSTTGTGEIFICTAFAYRVVTRAAALRAPPGSPLDARCLEALCLEALAEVEKLGGQGGCIALKRSGERALCFGTSAMPRGWLDEAGKPHVAIFEAEEALD
jgi:L-asparaginase / beta-aspartyl-peptidase